MNEFEIIEKFFAPLSHDGLKNDAASLDVPKNHELVICSDTLNQGVHFTSDHDPEFIAKKSLRVNVSDLVSCAARPWCYQLNLALPSDVSSTWIERFAQGLLEDQKKYSMFLSGGDTTRLSLDAQSSCFSVSITALGLIKKSEQVSAQDNVSSALTRKGALPGHKILVSGNIGDCYQEAYNKLPEPKLEYIDVLKDFASCAIDVSDGLLADLQHLCVASNIQAHIYQEDIPCSISDNFHFEDLISAGEDYEILACVPLEHVEKFQSWHCIGECAKVMNGEDYVQVFSGSHKDQNTLRKLIALNKKNKTGWKHFS